MINQNSSIIKEIIKSRKNKTNCFTFYNEIEDWLDNDKADAYLIDGCVFIFLKANGFYKFYYYVKELDDIKLSIDLLDNYKKNANIVLEFMARNGKNLDMVAKTIESIDFIFYAEYARVISGANAYKSDRNNEEENYCIAQLSNIEELMMIMYREFDIISDYLPSKEEIKQLIATKCIIIKKLDNKIAFIQIYEYKRGVLYSRMTWVEKKYRKPKYTIEFYKGLDAYLQDLNIKNNNLRSYGWINKKNKNYKINLKFGAKPDGTTSTIFIYKNKSEIIYEN